MPKSDKKYVKRTLSSPYKRTPSLPMSLTVDLTKLEIEDDEAGTRKTKSKISTSSRFDDVTPKKAKRKASKFWSKGN